jgi:hypothetical protein
MSDDRADGAFGWLLDDCDDSPFRWALWRPCGQMPSSIPLGTQPGSRLSDRHDPSPDGHDGLLGNVSELERRITVQVHKMIAAAGAKVPHE